MEINNNDGPSQEELQELIDYEINEFPQDEANGELILLDPNELTPEKIKELQAKQPPTVTRVEQYKIIAGMMMGHRSKKFPPFPRKFHVLRDAKGIKQYVEEKPGQVLRFVDSEMIIDAITNYSDNIGKREYVMTPNHAKDCFKRWSSMYPWFDDSKIAPVRQKSKPGYCWHRLDFDVSEGETPLFDEIMGRMTNSQAFQAWIGSLFDPKADRDQYVWLHGAGRNGKSTLGRMLARIFEQTARYEQVPHKYDKFWTSGLIGKRLIIFADCNEYQWVTSGMFKGLTGGDSTPIEIKNGPRYDAQLMCKFLFFSNDNPNISGGEADMRRAIYCEIDPITEFKPDREYEGKIWAEVPHIIHKCIKIYQSKTKESITIPLDEDDTINDLIAVNEEHYELFVHKYFNVLESDHGIDSRNLLSPPHLQDAFEREKISKHDQRYYRRYMARLGIKRTRYRDGADRYWRYSNATRKHEENPRTDKIKTD